MNMPAAPATHQWQVQSFLGVDSTNVSSGVDTARAVACPNMIRESVGKVRKRTGFYPVNNYGATQQINGVHFLKDGKNLVKCIHEGTRFVIVPPDGGQINEAYGAANYQSTSCQLGDKLLILDGTTMWILSKGSSSNYECKTTFYYNVRVPTIIIGRTPTGGGTVFEPLNMLTPKRTEQFLGKDTVKKYQLTSKNIDATPVTAQKMGESDEDWIDLVEGTDFTVDRIKGTVTFSIAPGKSKVLGKDNIKITYSKTIEGHADMVNHCKYCTVYGVNGARDRVFISGNPLYPNRDFYSQINDPTYFGDTWYCEIGSGDSRIVGYSVIGDQLATHLEGARDGTNIVLRRGQLSEVTVTSGTATMDGTESVSNSTSTTGPGNTASFRVTGSLQCDGAASPYAFATLETEPLFVTKNDILAVTPFDYSGERYAQSRAYYLQGMLRKLDLSNAYAVVWNGFYVLAAGEYLFFLDGTQAAYEKNAPYSTRQYEAYYWTGINARVLFVDTDRALCFGAKNGKIYKFHTDYTNVSHFHDEISGEKRAIHAYWQTPEIYGDDFYYRKDFRRIAVLLGAAVRTGCRIWGIYQGEKELLRDYDGTARYFSYEKFCYSKQSYKTDRTPQKLLEKIKVKKADSVSFLVENDLMDEPLMLYALAAEYTQRL